MELDPFDILRTSSDSVGRTEFYTNELPDKGVQLYSYRLVTAMDPFKRHRWNFPLLSLPVLGGIQLCRWVAYQVCVLTTKRFRESST